MMTMIFMRVMKMTVVMRNRDSSRLSNETLVLLDVALALLVTIVLNTTALLSSMYHTAKCRDKIMFSSFRTLPE